jgi:hypothetical protein
MSAVSAHPVRLEGRLDPHLSRWLWLVKRLLAIPHFVVVFFLAIAFVLLTIVAFFAILFTGRYPRGIAVNLGVLRWGGGSSSTPTARSEPIAIRPSRSRPSPTTRRA